MEKTFICILNNVALILVATIVATINIECGAAILTAGGIAIN